MKKELAKSSALRCASILVLLGLGGCFKEEPVTPESRASVQIEANSTGCNAEHPIAVHVTNISNTRIDGVELTILGRQDGHSSVVANSGPVTSDKILQPGETDSYCIKEPMVLDPIDAGAKIIYSPVLKRVWTIKD